MSNLKEEFEKTLRIKLEQKATTHTSEETLLVRYFRYFDLDNSNSVSKVEWVRAVEKIGVVVEDASELEQLFELYDTDKSGFLDYKEFSAAIFGEESRAARQLHARSSSIPAYQQRADDILDSLKEKVLARGVNGIIGLFHLYSVQDEVQERTIGYDGFLKGHKEYRIAVPDSDIDFLFKFLDSNGEGKINYYDFMRRIRGDMKSSRLATVNKAYAKLSEEHTPLTISAIEQALNAVGHPDVKSGKKTQDEVINTFISNFDLHHSMYGPHTSPISLSEFQSFYHVVSAVVDNDSYFDSLLNSCWRLYETIVPEKTNGKVETIASIGYDGEGPLDKLRNKLASRGARGILGLAKQFQIMDDDGSMTLSLSEFAKACRDFRVDVSETDIKSIFVLIDRDRSGYIDYDELLRSLRGPMNSFRRGFIEKAWSKIDKDGNGVLEISDIRGVYSASKHPDVKSGKKTEDTVLNEFLETFELHHNLGGSSDHKVTKEEFMDYYNNVSSSISDDSYFELMITNAWNLNGETKGTNWAGAFSSGARFNPNHKAQWLADHHRGHFSGSVIGSAPFGTSNEPTDWSTSLRPAKVDADMIGLSSSIQPAGGSSSSQYARFFDQKPRVLVLPPEQLFAAFKEKLSSRGARGLIGLSRQFKIMDDNQNKTLEFHEFSKALRDFRVDSTDEDLQRLFKYFDADGTGSIDYEEFIHRIRGEMNSSRKALVIQAYKKLDKNGDGTVNVEDLRGVYNASSHPEVRLGRKTEDEVLCEFLDTLEAHHYLYKGGSRDAQVTLEEFMEYYAHISASIEDDRYFDLMMRNAWNFDSKTYARAWKGEL